MAFDVELKFGGRRFKDAQKGLEALGLRLEKNTKGFNPAARKQLKDLLDTVIDALRQRHSSPWRAGQRLPTGNRQGRLAKRRGRTMRSLKGTVRGRGLEATGKLFGPFYLVTHEEGRTIRPKRSKFLAVPLPGALNKRGIPKRKGGPRAYKNTFVARSKKGNLLIFQKKRGGTILPIFLLTKKVRVPKRLGLKVTVKAAVPVFQDRLFDDLTKELLKGIPR